MIRRASRSLPNLSKSISRISLFDGQEDLSELSLGYCIGDNGLELLPAYDSSGRPYISAEALCSGKYYDSMDYNVLLKSNGQINLFKNELSTLNTFTDIDEGKPFAMEMRNSDDEPLIVIISGSKICTYNCSTLRRVGMRLSFSLYGGIAHCGRVFAVSGENEYKIVWSGFGLTAWSEAIDGKGYIILGSDLGKVLNLENFGDDILCVRESGFTIIHAMADSRNFRISSSHRSVSTGEKINVGGVIGQKYYFTKSEGLYSFDGTSIEKEYSVGNALSGLGRVYVYGDGYVYADCVYNGTNCIMRYDPSCGKAIFFGADCSNPMLLNGCMYCVKGGVINRMSTNAGDSRLWRSKPIGGFGRKTLKNLYVQSSGIPYITIVCDDIRRTFTSRGKIPVNFSGENIYVEISGNVPVTSVVAELEARK